jgi:hypothetical protein
VKAAIAMVHGRDDIRPEHKNRYRELSLGTLEVMSYDRLAETAIGAAKGLREMMDSLIRK